jgi:3-hydroxyisobutyrate dehydrogenase
VGQPVTDGAQLGVTTAAASEERKKPLAPGAIWAQMSTIGVAGTDRVAALARAERPDVLLLDAPVSGSREPAEHGQLTIFASGPGEARPQVAPLFAALGQRTIWVGEFSAQFALSLALKDVYLALQAAGDAGLPVLACLAGEWQQAVDQGLGGQDLTVVTRTIEQQGGAR